jgi:hypothetical protein
MRRGSSLLVLAIASTMCGCATVTAPPRPFADDKCYRKWIWIADAGPVAAEDPNTRQLALSAGLPTVGGESPPEDSC